MDVIIVEDEIFAVRKLENLLKKIDPDIYVSATLESVNESVKWLRNNTAPDFGFFDIQLSDASSFEIFRNVNVNFPVIFITAYEDYLIEAFEYNSIHYILKPVTEEKIRKAIQKIRMLKNHYENKNLQRFLSDIKPKREATKRLVVKKGMDYSPVEIHEIAYIFSEHKVSFIRDKNNNTYVIDNSLSDLEDMLDPELFFRANRQFIVSISAIKKFSSLEQSKIRLDLFPSPGGDVIIGKENAVNFRKWIRGI